MATPGLDFMFSWISHVMFVCLVSCFFLFFFFSIAEIIGSSYFADPLFMGYGPHFKNPCSKRLNQAEQMHLFDGGEVN